MSAHVRNIRAAIMVGSEGGKSFLASGYVRGQWNFNQRRSMVFDPWLKEKKRTDWGSGAWPCGEFDRWKRAVMTGPVDCGAVWDEGTTYGGRERDNVELFTAIRHRHPFFLFLGHRFDAMLPVMRTSLTDVIIGGCRDGDAEEWADLFNDDDLLIAAKNEKEGGLAQYEFLHKRAFQPVRRLRYTSAQIMAGITF